MKEQQSLMQQIDLLLERIKKLEAQISEKQSILRLSAFSVDQVQLSHAESKHEDEFELNEPGLIAKTPGNSKRRSDLAALSIAGGRAQMPMQKKQYGQLRQRRYSL